MRRRSVIVLGAVVLVMDIAGHGSVGYLGDPVLDATVSGLGEVKALSGSR